VYHHAGPCVNFFHTLSMIGAVKLWNAKSRKAQFCPLVAYGPVGETDLSQESVMKVYAQRQAWGL
jgi:hypothetical protein